MTHRNAAHPAVVAPPSTGRPALGTRVGVRWWLAVAMVGLGCRGGGSDGGPRPTAPPATARVQPPEPRSPPSVAQTTEAAPEAVPETIPAPAELATWVPVSVPYPPDAVVVGPVRDALPVALFPEELAGVRRRVVAQLEALDFEVVPIAELERIEAAAAQGQLVLEDDQRCEVPLTPQEVAERYFATHRHAFVYATCSLDCKVSVLVGRNDDERPMSRFASAPIQAPHDPSKWTQVTLRPAGTGVVWGVGGLSGSPNEGVTLIGVDLVGPWRGESTDPISNALGDDRRRCANPDGRVHVEWTLIASVDRRGSIDRCVARSAQLGGREADGQCLCDQVRTADLGPGRRGRRLRIQVLDQGSNLEDWTRLEPLQPGTEAWSRRLRAMPGVVDCLEMAKVRSPWSGTAVLPLSKSGRVGEVELLGDVTTPSVINFARCLVRELRNVALPCRPPGIDELRVGVVLDPL